MCRSAGTYTRPPTRNNKAKCHHFVMIYYCIYFVLYCFSGYQIMLPIIKVKFCYITCSDCSESYGKSILKYCNIYCYIISNSAQRNTINGNKIQERKCADLSVLTVIRIVHLLKPRSLSDCLIWKCRYYLLPPKLRQIHCFHFYHGFVWLYRLASYN